jgi:hypothetical protein
MIGSILSKKIENKPDQNITATSRMFDHEPAGRFWNKEHDDQNRCGA